MKHLIKYTFFIIALISTSAFRHDYNYEFTTKKIDNKIFNFAVPEGFCEFKDINSSNAISFVKCYELELRKKRLLGSFSEAITFSTVNDDKYMQNITDKYFAKIMLDSYKKTPNNGENFMDENYPIDSKYNAKIVGDNFIFSGIGYNNDSNIFQVFLSKIFLNRTVFSVLYTKHSTPQEKKILPNIKYFQKILQENQKINGDNEILFSLPEKSLLITKPHFDNFVLDTSNTDEFKEVRTFLYYNLKSSEKDPEKILVSVVPTQANESLNTIYKDYLKIMNSNENNKVSTIEYKDIRVIKIIDTKLNLTRYTTWVSLYSDIKASISLTLPSELAAQNEKKYIKNIYNYSKQLIEVNK